MADIVMMHPKTLELLKQHDDRGVLGRANSIGAADRFVAFGIPGLQIITSEFHPIEEWQGRYVLPNGRTFDPKNFRVSEGLVEYGPADLPLMEFMGIAKKLMVPWLRIMHGGWEQDFSMLRQEVEFSPPDDREFRKSLIMNRWGM